MILEARSTIARTAAQRGPVRIPGLPVLPSNVERHPVPGGGTRTVTLDAGDELTVIDREGRQRCELVVFDTRRALRTPPCIGAKGAGAPTGITGHPREREIPSAQDASGRPSPPGVSTSAGQPRCELFGDDSRAGESASFTATAPQRPWWPVRPGRPDAGRTSQCPPTEIVLYVRRALHGPISKPGGRSPAPATRGSLSSISTFSRARPGATRSRRVSSSRSST